VHNASMPDPLTNNRLKDVARQFVGFGQPADASPMLETSDHARPREPSYRGGEASYEPVPGRRAWQVHQGRGPCEPYFRR
jgi:hypothetical protein